ncbi:MAG TPA: hypothetical protein VGG28_13655 [Kofleriaceae bacterium]|jgi:hypothetical protein
MHDELDQMRRQIKRLGWALAGAMTSFFIAYFLGRAGDDERFGRMRDAPSADRMVLYWIVCAASFVAIVALFARRSSRIDAYNALIVATDPRLEGDHIPIIKT